MYIYICICVFIYACVHTCIYMYIPCSAPLGPFDLPDSFPDRLARGTIDGT